LVRPFSISIASLFERFPSSFRPAVHHTLARKSEEVTMIWGGLRPIRKQLVVDVVVILTATMVGVCYHHDDSGDHHRLLIIPAIIGIFPLALSYLLVYVTCDGVITKRWPLAFGLGALLLLHLLRWLLVLLFVVGLVHRQPISTTEPAAPAVEVVSHARRVGLILFLALHLILTLIMTGLVILFPAVELPIDDGPYAVGVYDCFIPITVQVPKTKQNNDDKGDETDVVEEQRDMAVRIYHPVARRHTTAIAGANALRPRRCYYKDYLNPQIGAAFCRHAILQAGPPLLQKLDFLLHHWRLPQNVAVYIPDNDDDDDDIIDKNDDDKAATIMAKIKKMMNHHHDSINKNNDDQDNNDGSNNVIFYSHGLGGCYDVYSYQPRYLVSHGGCIVVAVTHLDGSAAVAPHRNGIDVIPHNYDINYTKLDEVSYVRERRRQTNVRIQELTQAAAWYQRQNFGSSSLGESSRNGAVKNSPQRIGTQQQPQPQQQQERSDRKFVFMGHSFGATTVLGVLARHPHLVRAVVAHEPPTDWLPNDVRQRFFYGQNDYTGGTGGYDDNDDDDDYDPSNNKNNEIIHQSLHDDGIPILLLHSDEWAQKGFGSISIIRDMHQQFGQKNHHLFHHHHHEHHVIADACHMEFSDTCLMTPVWLGRAVGITNPRRSPCKTAREIAATSWRFIQKTITTTFVIDDDENVDGGRGSNGSSNNGNGNDSHKKKTQ
jgi:pimeloyl-ACP methyl ester carboxylesterase